MQLRPKGRNRAPALRMARQSDEMRTKHLLLNKFISFHSKS